MDVELKNHYTPKKPTIKSVRFIEACKREGERQKSHKRLITESGILNSSEQHLAFFVNQMMSAESSVVIVSSHVSRSFLHQTFFPLLNNQKKTIDITVYTSHVGRLYFFRGHLQIKGQLTPCLPEGISVYNCGKFPSEILIVDNKLYVQGNFPWLKGEMQRGVYSTFWLGPTVDQLAQKCIIQLVRAVKTAKKDESLKGSIVSELKLPQIGLAKPKYNSEEDLAKLSGSKNSEKNI